MDYSLIYADLDQLKVLLSNKADPNVSLKSGSVFYTPLHYFSQRGDYDKVEQLTLALANVNSQVNQFSPLHMSSANDHWKISQLLIDSRADCEGQDSLGSTPIMISSANNNIENMKVLIKSKANLNARRYESGVTALLLAVQEQRFEAVKLLLESGCSVSFGTLGETGGSPLTIACGKNNYQISSLLLQYKADPQIINETYEMIPYYLVDQNRSPLSLIVRHDNLEICDLLLSSAIFNFIVS